MASLSTENAALHCENERLLRRVAELEASNDMNNTQQHQLDSTAARKRTRHESGVTLGYDSSESADGVYPSGHGDHRFVLDGCREDDHDVDGQAMFSGEPR